ncbi:N-acetylmuramoyl-L-alanine amidase [Candidatus Arthromitus sp. SFB-mouse-Japan]|uniref:peptidoglycan recognition protein family protein n=1 Tax=unclassified Candidatus Neoarthromitus TaxID=2638829 RepID=UPI00021B7E7B|nr:MULTISPECIES: peptidoglycan recognition family protein [unclassified Candidatus Arthromitus]EIA22299.1 N-acetylmuramoyl-L-alanine amidase family 2 [Candidatus Arthromitus sp. SFB-2]EIA24446.1 N-acetylmuramoyl-L-alanine amidase family 2 [Candidatus Arthromitus sp. SFB-1]EIA27210.1 N-acetylmuramoyl-L-alanine amidase family 2 [Candidatus Arthromitus sp. SFB-co]EIA27682.1 N-acetylmuramoyl-L-alanine amidase family 2 [Candidatus Arthromitus sp. SFB-4]EIA29886.1 N-acetylmuramoyl-L-alanine amidase 
MKQYLLKEKLISNNFSNRENKKIEYIVVHDTGNWDEGAGLDRHYNFFENVSDNASYHYLVGNEDNEYKIYNLVGEEYRSWHCGDGRGKYGITNDNSIGIGMCVNKDSDHKNNILGMARLAAELLIKHDLTMDKLVRHYDASRKVCPEFMSSDDWKLWNGFYDLTSFIFNVLQGGGDILDIEMQIRDNCEKFIETYLNSFYIDDSISSGENDFEESLRTVVENKEE